MRHHLWTVCLACLVGGIVLAEGCASKTAIRDKPPPDPLFVTKKPIEGKQHLTEARHAPEEDYSPPPRPDDEVRPVRLMGLRPVGDPR
jgi:hypothetical protein